MSANERKISFLNKYFIYKKVRNVDADKVTAGLLHKSEIEEQEEEKASEEAQEVVEKTIRKKKPRAKKIKKIKLRQVDEKE